MLSGSFSIWHWAIVLILVIAIFGTRKLRGAGGDLGEAIRSFKSAMREGAAPAPTAVTRTTTQAAQQDHPDRTT